VSAQKTGPLDIALGIFGGCLLILLAGGYGCAKGCESLGEALFSKRSSPVEAPPRRPEPPKPPPPPPPPAPPRPEKPTDWSPAVFWVLMIGGVVALGYSAKHIASNRMASIRAEREADRAFLESRRRKDTPPKP
jgi:hypothetical protein